MGEVVNIFSCCIFTWNALTTMLPAFLLAGAVAAFVSRASVVRYFGPRAPKPVAYGTAAVSGMLLSLCSCNIVPLFVSIYLRGAGLGPAITFLYAGPAINVLSLIWVIRVIGWRLGVWRAAAVPVLAVVIGLLMAWLFSRQEAVRVENEPYYGDAKERNPGPPVALVGLLLSLVIVGGMDNLTLAARLVAAGVLMLAGVALLWRCFTRAEIADWLRETWKLVKLVLPILIPAVLIIGLIAKYVPLKWIYTLVGSNHPLSVLGAAGFGAFMYFPILSEVPFVKTFLKLGMNVGPGLAILLLAPGLSLPGMLIVRKVLGRRRLFTYVLGLVLLVSLVSWAFGFFYGDYVCPCMLPEL